MGSMLAHPEPLQTSLSSGGASMGSATIGRSVRIRGEISSQEDLYINGEIEGIIVVTDRKLTVGPDAKVHATVAAREVVLLGSIRGDVEATDKIEIRKDASLVGDIKTPRIVIEDGAYFKGSIDIVQIRSTRLAVLGSREADEADGRAEREIGEQKYLTLDDTNSLRSVLASLSDDLSATASVQEPATASWGRR